MKASDAFGETPIQRLRKLNEPAYSFYLDKGVDLEKEYLEIALSAQHNNGGLSIDSWWQSNIKGLFPVGEVAASHGVYRPGGSALNAGQCGSRRASSWILSYRTGGEWSKDEKAALDALKEVRAILDGLYSGSLDAEKEYKKARLSMSINASAIRNVDLMEKTLGEVDALLENFSDVKVERPSKAWILFELRNALIEQKAYLFAMIDYAKVDKASRGSALYSDKDGKVKISFLDPRFSYTLEDEKKDSLIQEVQLDEGSVIITRRKARNIPQDDDFFENVWASYRENKNVY